MEDTAAAAGLGFLVLAAIGFFFGVAVGYFVVMFAVRSGSRADVIVACLTGTNRRLDLIGKLLWEEAECQRQTTTPSASIT
jgi:hypothetical protein